MSSLSSHSTVNKDVVTEILNESKNNMKSSNSDKTKSNSSNNNNNNNNNKLLTLDRGRFLCCSCG